jgi:hypothetical protein
LRPAIKPARRDGAKAPAGGAILADRGSVDQRAHASAVIKVPCPAEPDGCGALQHERCAAGRYPSGRASAYYRGPDGTMFHPARVRAAREARIRRSCLAGYAAAKALAEAENRREHWAAAGDPVIAEALALFDLPPEERRAVA